MDVIDFPDDLVQTQAACHATYDALAAPRPRDTTALRRRLLFLSVRLWWHPTGRPPPRCRRYAPNCASSPAPTEPCGPRDRSPRSTRSTRLRQGLCLSVALDVALSVARPARPSPCPRRSPRRFAVVGLLTSPLRLLCPCPLAGVKEEGTGGIGGAAAAGDRGALSQLRVGRGRRASPPSSRLRLRIVLDHLRKSHDSCYSSTGAM